jgi:rubrerythrin
MDDVSLFLAHAITLERDAARRFEDLTHAMRTSGNREAEALFRRLSELSRMHLKAAMDRGGFQKIPELAPEEYNWPGGLTPEAASWKGADEHLDVLSALELALAGETSGYDYYSALAETATDPEVAHMAKTFAEEESEHVSELKRWITRYAA